MSTDVSVDRHSTLANFELVAGGQSYPVAQVARDFILLDKPVEVPTGPATLLIRVEGEDEIRREIEVLAQTETTSRRISIARS